MWESTFNEDGKLAQIALSTTSNITDTAKAQGYYHAKQGHKISFMER